MWQRIYRQFFPAKSPSFITREYGIPTNVNLNFRFTNDGWMVVTSPDLPGLLTEARTGQELLDNLNDAILTYYDVPKRVGDIVFDKVNIAGKGSVSYETQVFRTA